MLCIQIYANINLNNLQIFGRDLTDSKSMHNFIKIVPKFDF